MHVAPRFIAPAIALAAALAAPGAARTAEDVDAKLNRLVGRTMERFIRDSGVLPSDALPVRGGKVFIVVNGACQLWLDAAPTGPGSTSSDWTITAVRYSGPC